MSDDTYKCWDLGIKLFTSCIAIFAIYQFRETKRKRHIEMYWKVAELYYSKEQRNGREKIDELRRVINEWKKEYSMEQQINLYNKDFHLSTEKVKKGFDKSIINRIRFINQAGVLLTKKLIDKDLLFGLIGVGFEFDYPIIMFVIEAHRRIHNMPHIYREVETTWEFYQNWKSKSN